MAILAKNCVRFNDTPRLAWGIGATYRRFSTNNVSRRPNATKVLKMMYLLFARQPMRINGAAHSDVQL